MKKKDDAIIAINSEFEVLANLTLEQLDMMEKIITMGKLKVKKDDAQKIDSNEKEINEREVKLSENIINTIVLYQPVASEIRRIIACYRIIISLERISDLVVDVVNFITKIETPEVYERLHEILSNMTLQSIEMVRTSLLAFLNKDKESAIWTIKNDDAFGEINHKLLKKILNKTSSADSKKHLMMSIISIKEMMTKIERIADHATNIAEAAIYTIEGKDIRHQN